MNTYMYIYLFFNIYIFKNVVYLALCVFNSRSSEYLICFICISRIYYIVKRLFIGLEFWF